jgi:glucose/arabinose dehydrogenase
MKQHISIILLIFLSLVSITGSGQKSPSINNLIPFATGFNSPVCISNAGDSRLFITEQAGLIQILDSAGNINPMPFLDIRDRILSNGSEKGLLGLAFHPNYNENRYFYVNYIGNGDSSHISRFSANPDHPEQADPQSEFKLITLKQPYSNHNGGDLKFGPDGYLYIGFGDGGSSGDPQNRSQNPAVFFGKMLRIDVDNGDPYAIPTTNPFVDSTNYRKEIWASGLRNPWRFSFDRLNGDLWIADVGQNKVEEIDFQPSTSKGGENYGWRCYEGNQQYNMDSCTSGKSLTAPVYTYTHSIGCSVTGGYVYRGDPASAFYGYYFFTDFCTDIIWTLHRNGDSWLMEEFGEFKGNNFSTFGEDARGNLYIAGITSGTIYRLFEINTTDKAKKDKITGIRIKHNPASNKISIENDNISQSAMHVSLFDVKGLNHFIATTSEPVFEFNPGFLSSGIYILKIGVGNNTLIHKIFIAARNQ